MPTEIAYLTPKEKTGNAIFMDFWNADLFDGASHIGRMDSINQVLFKDSEHTWSQEFDVGADDGVIQGIFSVDDDDDYLVVAKLSSSHNLVNLYVNDSPVNLYFVNMDGDELAALVSLKKGIHSMTIIQMRLPYIPPNKELWFHSITVFQV